MARIPTALTALAAALLLTACSAGSAPDEDAAASSPAAEAPASSESAPAAQGGDTAMALLAVVGTEDDPEAYEIAVTDMEGMPVTSVPAGDYSITFVDESMFHNFHMTGPGGVDIATDVAGSDTSTVEVTLEAGTYEYVCDPHVGSMSGTLEVTG